MKKCPHCNSEVETDFDVCWNCQYSFEDHRVLDNSDFKLICPSCNTETSSSFRYCTTCHFDLKDIFAQMGIKPTGPKKIDCLRCKVPMEYDGNFKFHEGTRYGVWGNMFELFTNRESFDLYHCPECGKVEFFLP